jgi:hypothetical protein
MVALHGHLHLHTTMAKSLGSQAHGFDSHHFTLKAQNISSCMGLILLGFVQQLIKTLLQN